MIAYFDPGSTNFFLQIIIAFLAGIVVMVSSIMAKIKSLFSRKASYKKTFICEDCKKRVTEYASKDRKYCVKCTTKKMYGKSKRLKPC